MPEKGAHDLMASFLKAQDAHLRTFFCSIRFEFFLHVLPFEYKNQDLMEQKKHLYSSALLRILMVLMLSQITSI